MCGTKITAFKMPNLKSRDLAATGDYLILTDGDCIPRQDFVSQHRAASRPGCFLSGGYFKLPWQ